MVAPRQVPRPSGTDAKAPRHPLNSSGPSVPTKSNPRDGGAFWNTRIAPRLITGDQLGNGEPLSRARGPRVSDPSGPFRISGLRASAILDQMKLAARRDLAGRLSE